MLEQLKAALVTLLVLCVFFGGGVLVGLKLPETDTYKRWSGEPQGGAGKLKPIQVAAVQILGSNLSADDLGAVQSTQFSESCPGGVCRLPEPGEAAQKTVVVAPEKSLDLTFYSELADKPTESGGSALRVKATPVVKKNKSGALKVDKYKGIESSTKLWEVRICSLPHEIKARLERSKLMKEFPGVEIEPVQVVGKGTWYRVKISGIKELKEAERYQRELSRKYHYKPLIRRQ